MSLYQYVNHLYAFIVDLASIQVHDQGMHSHKIYSYFMNEKFIIAVHNVRVSFMVLHCLEMNLKTDEVSFPNLHTFHMLSR